MVKRRVRIRALAQAAAVATEADVRTVVEVVTAVAAAATPEKAVSAAFEAVRTQFGWVYGSCWRAEGKGTAASPAASG